MRQISASFFRFIFKNQFFRNKYYGFHSRIFQPLQLFKNVKKEVVYRDSILLSLDLNDWIQQQIYFLGDYEKPEIDFLYQTLKKEDVFLDIGANIGIFSLNASKIIGDTGRVYAFEPFSPNFEKLKNHISVNQFQNCIPEHLAISDKQKNIEIFYNNKENNVGMASAFLQKFDSKERVEAVSLDDYVEKNDIKNITLVKMDIEGGEFLALLGMKHILAQQKPILLMEVNTTALKNSGYQEKDLLQFLSQHHYQKTQILSKNTESYNAVFQYGKE